MSASSAGRARGYLIASALWLVIVAALALAYRGWVQPRRHQNLTAATSARPPYLQEIAVGGDRFSGYALLRSPAFRADLQREGLRLRWVEDSGDVAARLESLRTGELHLTAMSLDALLIHGARVGFPGAIVLVLDIRAEVGRTPDVLVARREFLRDQPERVQAVLAAEARALWQYRHAPAGLQQLVQEDAQNHGTALTEDQAGKIAAGIQWQNVQENYAFFQLLPAAERSGLPGLEELIADRTEGLMRTQNLTTDPLVGRRHSSYYDRPLAALQTARFHPGRPADRPRPGGASAAASQPIGRSEPEATALREEEWQQLRPLAELRTEPIVFSRGSAELSTDGQQTAAEWLRQLQQFPEAYLRVRGHARPDGDPEANRALAQARADAVVHALITAGLDPRRVHAEVDVPRPSGSAGASIGEAQAVGFSASQVPY